MIFAGDATGSGVVEIGDRYRQEASPELDGDVKVASDSAESRSMEAEAESGRAWRSADYGLEVTRYLSEVIGPRPPCSQAEADAAAWVAGEFRSLGLEPTIEAFKSGRSFGPGYMAVFGLALAGSALQRRRRWRTIGYGLAALAAGTAIAEGRNSKVNPLRLLRGKVSRSVHAEVTPGACDGQTVCLISHLDSSRSGLMFHPAVTPRLGLLVAGAGVSTLLQTVSGVLAGFRGFRQLDRLARLFVLIGLMLVAEREVRGKDVPGANDNASGVGACLELARRLTRDPLARTRVVVLVTGSEESGTLGMRNFLDRHRTSDWVFINFDGVGADAPLRVLAKEGGPLGAEAADARLLELAAEIGRANPELIAPPLKHGSGLPYDSTPVLTAGGRAISIVNQGEGAIPDYHWPTDRFDHISLEAFNRAVRFAWRLLKEIDRQGQGPGRTV